MPEVEDCAGGHLKHMPEKDTRNLSARELTTAWLDESHYQDFAANVHSILSARSCCHANMTPSVMMTNASNNTLCIAPWRASCVPSPMARSDKRDSPRTISGSIG